VGDSTTVAYSGGKPIFATKEHKPDDPAIIIAFLKKALNLSFVKIAGKKYFSIDDISVLAVSKQ
jgi:hypothetical protein